MGSFGVGWLDGCEWLNVLVILNDFGYFGGDVGIGWRLIILIVFGVDV